jgi:hypothetical protein
LQSSGWNIIKNLLLLLQTIQYNIQTKKIPTSRNISVCNTLIITICNLKSIAQPVNYSNLLVQNENYPGSFFQALVIHSFLIISFSHISLIWKSESGTTWHLFHSGVGATVRFASKLINLHKWAQLATHFAPSRLRDLSWRTSPLRLLCPYQPRPPAAAAGGGKKSLPDNRSND